MGGMDNNTNTRLVPASDYSDNYVLAPNDSQLTRHHPMRQVPNIRPGVIVTIESSEMCCTARITDVRRTGQHLARLMVTLEPVNEFGEFLSGLYAGRTSAMMEVQQNGLSDLSGDNVPSIEVAW